VEIAGPGSNPVEAVASGAADVGAGLFEDVVRAAAAGRPLKAFALMTRSPLLAIVAHPSRRRVSNIADLLTVSTALPSAGSPEQVFLNYNFYVEGGVPVDLKTLIAGDADAVIAAIASRKAGAAVVDNVALRRLAQQVGSITVLADTRTIAGVLSVYGVPVYPGAALFATESWLHSYPREARKLSAAILMASASIRNSRPELLAASIPETRSSFDSRDTIEAVRESAPLFSETGVIPDDGAAAALKALSVTLQEVRNSAFELRACYTNEFLPGRAAQS
jgi:NitT/TauT family transport system substrate-binding protein